MAITMISIDDESGEISVERATKCDSLELGVRQIRPDGEKGWLVALLTQKWMAKLITKSLDELQAMHLEQLKFDA